MEQALTLTAGGTGYTSNPTVTLVGGTSGTVATAIATITTSSGPVTSLTLLTPGSGYTSAPTVSFSGGGGSSATATATISMGALAAVTIGGGGNGYTTPPTVSFSGGGGTGAAASASIFYFSTDVEFHNIHCWQCLGTQIWLRRTNGFILLRSFLIDCTQQGLTAAYQVNWNAAVFGNGSSGEIGGLEFDRFDVIGSEFNSVFSVTRYALWIQGTSSTALGIAAFLNRVLIDSWYAGTAIYIQNMDSCFGKDVECTAMFGYGLYLDTVTNSNFTNTAAFGAGSQSGLAGIILLGCKNVQMANVRAEHMNGYGLLIIGSTVTGFPSNYCRFTNVSTNQNTLWGIYEYGAFGAAAACDHNEIVNAAMSGNTSGSIYLNGANSNAIVLIPNSATYVSALAGPTNSLP